MVGEGYGSLVGELNSIEELRERLRRLERTNTGELTYPTDMPYLTEADMEKIGYFSINPNLEIVENALNDIERTTSKKREARKKCEFAIYRLGILKDGISDFKNVASNLSNKEVGDYIKNLEAQIRNIERYCNKLKEIADRETNYMETVEEEMREGIERYREAEEINRRNELDHYNEYLDVLGKVLGEAAERKYMDWCVERILERTEKSQ